jgi:hypothetical protein
MAAALKVYPALLVFGLIPLKKYRAFTCAIVACAAVGIFRFADLPNFNANVKHLVAHYSPLALGGLASDTHSLSGTWKFLWWEGGRLGWLLQMPPVLGAFCIIMPGVLWVSYRMYRSANRSELVYPYFLWLAAAATFLPEVANDYNLVFLILGAIAVWDRRDPVIVHLGMALMLLWAQPIAVTIGPRLLLGFKVASLAAVGLSLLTRIREQDVPAEGEARLHIARPIPAAA